MTLPAPNLDNRRFADIFAEAKSLIPRYAPEWTDHNESDPGITLLQLFAWLTDLLLYRINQIPDRNYIKFLELIGVTLTPAHPATAELTFTLARPDIQTAPVPVGTQVAVEGGGGDAPVIFETDETLIAFGSKLAAVQVYDGFGYSVETSKNNASGQWFLPFGVRARVGSALMLGFDPALPFPSDQINLAVSVYTQGLKAEGTHCDLDLSVLPAPATLVWEYWDMLHWEPLDLDSDETRALTRSGHIYLRGPGGNVKKDTLGEVKDPLYWLRCRLAQSGYDMSPRLEMVLTNTVHATQAQTARDQIVGGSSGMPNQTMQLANFPVVTRDKPEKVMNADGSVVSVLSLRLEIDEGSGMRVWQEVEDFYGSLPDDPHYLLNRTTGEIQFGDGRHGRIPTANPDQPNDNIVARVYRYGGGKRGNVGAGTITALQTYVPSIDTVSNKKAATGGDDQETLDDAKLRAPRAIVSRERAVTGEDFENLALETPGARVRRAHAMPLTHPKFPGNAIPGVVTVIVVPESDAPDPLPGAATLSAVCAHLNLHRLLTSEVYVVPPTYRKIMVQAQLVARGEAELGQVKRAVQERLTTYFHPLRGGDKMTGWEFGGEIYYSNVYRVVFDTPGVERIDELILWLDNERQPFCQNVTIGEGVLLSSENHDVQVRYAR